MRRSWLIALFLAAAGARSYAHHAIGAVYDASDRETVTGIVTEFRFIHPHPLLFIDVRTETGVQQSWRLEMDNRFELARIGLTAQTFRPGDRVIATGSLGRVRSQSLYVRRLERPADGLRYEQRGTTPTLSRGSR